MALEIRHFKQLVSLRLALFLNWHLSRFEKQELRFIFLKLYISCDSQTFFFFNPLWFKLQNSYQLTMTIMDFYGKFFVISVARALAQIPLQNLHLVNGLNDVKCKDLQPCFRHTLFSEGTRQNLLFIQPSELGEGIEMGKV